MLILCIVLVLRKRFDEMPGAFCWLSACVYGTVYNVRNNKETLHTIIFVIQAAFRPFDKPLKCCA